MAQKTCSRLIGICLLVGSADGSAATLTFSKVGPVSVPAGETFEYALSYTCTATTQGENCDDAVITDVMPANVEIVGCGGNEFHQQLPAGVDCPTGRNRTATFCFSEPGEPSDQPGTLAAGSTGILSIEARFTAGTTDDGASVDNTATISASNATDVISNPVTTTPQAEDKLTINKTRLSSGSTKGEETLYEIEVCQPAGSDIGGLNATSLTISELIPAGASYVDGSASNGGQLVLGTPDKVVWDTPFFLNVRDNANCLTRTFSILYPVGFVPDAVTNTARVTYTPVGEVEKSIEGQVTHGFETGSVAAGFAKNDSGTNAGQYPINTDPGFEWRVDVSNTGTVALQNVVITDPVPPQVKVNRIAIGSFIPSFSISVQYQLDDTGGTWHDLPGNPYTSSANIDVTNLSPAPTDSNQITVIRWSYGEVPPGFRRSGNT